MSKPPLKRPPTSGTRKGNGAGWGGPAQGSGTGGEPVAFEAGNQAASGRQQPDLSKAERIARLQDNLEHLALYGENENVRVSASNHLLNRLDGMPIARNINVNADDLASLSDADIAAELARLGGAGIEAAAGDAPTPSPARLKGVVH